jgi:hypothetical protein
MQWDEVALVQGCSTNTTTRFIFDNIITRFGFRQSLTNDQGAHFLNITIATLTHEFLIQHHKRIPYHLQANRTMEAFNKILEKGLTKVCCANHEDWDERVLKVLWAYWITTNKLHKYTPFQLVYGQESMVPAKFISPSLFVAQATQMIDDELIVARVTN